MYVKRSSRRIADVLQHWHFFQQMYDQLIPVNNTDPCHLPQKVFHFLNLFLRFEMLLCPLEAMGCCRGRNDVRISWMVPRVRDRTMTAKRICTQTCTRFVALLWRLAPFHPKSFGR